LKTVTLFAFLAILAQGCLFGTKDNPATCQTNDECASKVCNLATYYCEPVNPDSGQAQGGTGGAAPDGPGGTGGTAIDGQVDSQPDASIVTDAPADQRIPELPDTRVPDAAGTCGGNGDCTDPSKAFCVAGVCVGCQPGLDGGVSMCTAPTGVCDTTSGRCVGCTASSQCATPAAPICDTTKNTCVVCAADLQCQTKNTAIAACRSDGQCVQCTATTVSTSCIGTTPACDLTTNTCVQCITSANCAGATPICGTNEKCQACATDPDCTGLNDPARVACAAGGACVQCTATNITKCTGTTTVCNTTSNKCVQCLTNATCAGTAPICATATNTCRGCAVGSDCASFAGHTACAASGACVQCTDNTTCSGTMPICGTGTNTCRTCSSDSECSAIGPGVCMADGHCATDSETVYVQNLAGTCSDTVSGAGSAATPYCTAAIGVSIAGSTSGKDVVVLTGALADFSVAVATKPLTVVGKKNAVITPAAPRDGITITNGTVYLRNVTVQGSANPATGMGVNAQPSPGNTITLYLTGCTVNNNPGGGIMLNGAAFDIEGTTVTGNGPGQTPIGLTWGGIRVDSLPTSGPTILNRVTVQNNDQVGISCSGAITGTGVLATGNNNSTSSNNQITSSCGFTSCGAASATCGASLSP
jgi:hypothetical protein